MIYADASTLRLEQGAWFERRSSVDAQWEKEDTIYWYYGWQTEAMKALYQLESLQENWDGYQSPAPSKDIIERAKKLLLAIDIDNITAPHIVPLADGGIQFEWRVNSRELEFSILPGEPIEFLKAENGRPIDEGPLPSTNSQIKVLVSWLFC